MAFESEIPTSGCLNGAATGVG